MSEKIYYLITAKHKDKRRKNIRVIFEGKSKPTLEEAEKIVEKETIYYFSIDSIINISLKELELMFGKKHFPYKKL